MEIKRPKLTHGIVNRVTTSLFSYQGWPTVARDEKGVLYAVASSFRISHICPFGKTAMYKSFDGGKTWTPPIVINDTYVDDRDAGIVYLGNGKNYFNLGSQSGTQKCTLNIVNTKFIVNIHVYVNYLTCIYI
jgi:Neuraminidase (sialidase)